MEALKNADKRGHAYGSYLVGVQYLGKRDFKEAAEALMKAKKAKFIDANIILAIMYEKGLYFSRSKIKSTQLLLAAAKRNNAVAQAMLFLDFILESDRIDHQDLASRIDQIILSSEKYNRRQVVIILVGTRSNVQKMNIDEELILLISKAINTLRVKSYE